MRKILAVIKILLLIFWTLAVYSVYAVGFIFLKLFKMSYEPWRNRCLQIWGRIALGCLSIKVEIKGKVPEPPFFLVCNHLSYIDIFIFYYCLKTTFVSKAEVKHWLVVGLMARSLGVIFINRKRKRDVFRVNTIISSKINKNQGVVLFPEGRTSAGDRVFPFLPPLLQHPAIEGLDVHYAAIRYQTGEEDEPASQSVSWWDEVSLLPHMIRLASNRSIKAQVTFGEDKIRGNDRKLLAAELQKKVESIFVPMVQKDVDESKKAGVLVD